MSKKPNKENEHEVPSSHWNYRIIQDKDYLQIYEVFYTKGEVDGWSENPIHPGGDNLDDLKGDLEYMNYALEKPILKLADLEASTSAEGAGGDKDPLPGMAKEDKQDE